MNEGEPSKEMKMKLFFILSISIINVCHSTNLVFSNANLLKLMKRNKYSKHDPPMLDASTEVKLGIYIINFNAISEQTMDYSLSLNLRQSWNDPRLNFKNDINATTSTTIITTTPVYQLHHQHYSNLADTDPTTTHSTHIHPSSTAAAASSSLDNSNSSGGSSRSYDDDDSSLKFDRAWTKIWVPDTFFRNEKKASFHSITIENRLFFVKTNGDVWYDVKISATLSCPMNLHKYPLDTQVCPMMFESFGYTTDVMQLNWLDEPVEVNKNLYIPQYFYRGGRLYDCSTNYTGGSFPCLKINFVLQRNVGYFTIQVFFPTFLIVILSWVSFWISVDAVPARVSLGLLTVLTMTNLSIGINSNLPRVSYIKAIDIWMSACLLFVFSALCEYAFVNVASRHKVITRHAPILPKETKFSKCLKRVRQTFTLPRRPDQETSPHLRGLGLSPQVTLAPFLKGGKHLDGKARAERIDNASRKCFPLVFALFNVVYWIGYIYIVKDDHNL